MSRPWDKEAVVLVICWCVGKLYDLVLGPEHLKQIEELGREDPGRGNRWRETH